MDGLGNENSLASLSGEELFFFCVFRDITTMTSCTDAAILLGIHYSLPHTTISTLMHVMKRWQGPDISGRLRLCYRQDSLHAALRRTLGKEESKKAISYLAQNDYRHEALLSWWNVVLSVSELGSYAIPASQYRLLGFERMTDLYAYLSQGEYEEIATYLNWITRSKEIMTCLKKDDWGGVAKRLPYAHHYDNLSLDLANAWLTAKITAALQ